LNTVSYLRDPLSRANRAKILLSLFLFYSSKLKPRTSIHQCVLKTPSIMMLLAPFSFLIITIAVVAAAEHRIINETIEAVNFDTSALSIPQTNTLTDRNLLFTTALCDQVRAALPQATCTCTRPSLLRNRGFTVQCVNNQVSCIPFIGCFTISLRGEYFLLRTNRLSTSEYCLTETLRAFDVLCIKGIHCKQDPANCYESCTAKVGTVPCKSCTVCPDRKNPIADCTNVNPLLLYNACSGANVTSIASNPDLVP
jgi:hypothetical protein